MATIKKQLASGTHTLLDVGAINVPIKAITIAKRYASTGNLTATLSIQEDGGAQFFLLRSYEIPPKSTFVIDNEGVLSYDKAKNSLIVNLNTDAQIMIFT